jgi:hypothetical protein
MSALKYNHTEYFRLIEFIKIILTASGIMLALRCGVIIDVVYNIMKIHLPDSLIDDGEPINNDEFVLDTVDVELSDTDLRLYKDAL